MAGKKDSPSVSTPFLPLAKTLRRASVTSITSLFDKQSLNQTLDQIHSSASQSETLTTFNDFTSPPPSNAAPKKQAESGGIGSWYNRMTSSVHSSKSTKSSQDAQNIRSRASTGRSGESAETRSTSQVQAQGQDESVKSVQSSMTQSEGLLDSHDSLRTPSRRSQQSQNAETESFAGSDQVAKPGTTKMPIQGPSHKPTLSTSSQKSATQVANLSAQDPRAETKQLPATLKRALTPEPSAPMSPLIQDLDISRASLSRVAGSSQSRTPSVSSNTSTRARKPNLPSDGRRASAFPGVAGAEISPTLSRFSSAPNVKVDPRGESRKELKDAAMYDGMNEPESLPSSARQVSKGDAIEALKRLQDQGLDSVASMRAQTQTVGATLTQLKNRVLSRQYWMKDENAKDCFYCGDPFSTFRRKHHCRTCGQIFDAKCTTLVSGASFAQSGNIRVCKSCEGLINGYDDSSDYTDDDTASIMTSRTKHRNNSRGDSSPTRPSTPGHLGIRSVDTGLQGSRSNLNTFKSHLPSVVGRRMIDDLKRTSGQYEDDFDKKSIRPGSSRSMKSFYGMRPHTGHRRHHSKHLLQRNSRHMNSDKAPFYRDTSVSTTANDRLPAFHSDNVIDPDLAEYLSDDAESDDDEHSIAGVLATSGKSRGDEAAGPHSSAVLKRPRSRYGDQLRILTGSQLDIDAASISSSRVGTPSQHGRRRGVSFTGSAFQSSPPKPQRLSVAAQQWSSPNIDNLVSGYSHGRSEVSQMTRSVSMQGPRAPPVELNNASLQHGKRLLRQMLAESSISNTEGWEKALIPILLRATDDVVPNVQGGDAINITNYVKLKKVPGGRMGDTMYISGVVFSKNVALKSMKRHLENPRILIITFALEYARHEQHFMSLEPVIRQEREYLQNLVNRIATLKPQLLLVQRNVSGLAIEMLDKAGISTAYNVKRSVLEAISRCCQTRIITSMDKLATLPDSLSSCESFYLKTFVYENRRKTYMYLAGCPKELGCTIVLRGANTSTLRRIKRVAEFMLQAIYNLRLETSLMRDEFALIPAYGAEGTIRYEPLATARTEIAMASKDENSRPPTANGIHGNGATSNEAVKEPEAITDGTLQQSDTLRETLHKKPAEDEKHSDLPDDVPAPTFYSDLVEKQRTRILSTSPFVKFMQPYLLMRARESERRLMHLKRLLDQDIHDLSLSDAEKPDKFVLITPEMINETVQGASRNLREVLQAVHLSEYDKATHVYKTQSKQWEASVINNTDMFNPLSHQSITVLHSLISTSTNITCTGPDVFTIKFYDDRPAGNGPEADCTLGQYVEDTCVSANEPCHINGCDKKMHQHHRHYAHGEARLEVTVERMPAKAPGLEEIPLMWSICRVCGQETQAVPISNNTWNYSFGKYLELSFWSIPLKPRAAICPHDLHHDHRRYFGYRNWAIRLQYDPINLLEVIVPRTRITWKVVNDLKFKNENFRKAEKRLNKFVTSVKGRLKAIRLDALLPEKVDECRDEIDKLTRLINEDQRKVLEKLQEKYVGSKFYEIVPFNRAMRMLHEKAGEWDEIFAEFAESFLPSEKDIKRLATIQVKNLLFGNEESGVSMSMSDETANTSFSEDQNGEASPDGTLASASDSQIVSPEKAQDVMTAVVTENARDAQRAIEEEKADMQFSEQITDDGLADPNSPRVEHLDLAVSSPTSSSGLRTSGILSPRSDPLTLGQPLESIDPLATTSEVASPATDTPSRSSTNQGTLIEKVKSEISGIPRYMEQSRRQSNTETLVSAQRSQSQPANVRDLIRTEAVKAASPLSGQRTSPESNDAENDPSSVENTPKPKRRLSQRLANLRTSNASKIPKSVNSNRKDSRVSALAKHFEHLISREFQQERLRDQRKRAGRQRQAGAYPAAALKPVVEVYHNLQEAVGEHRAAPTDGNPIDGDATNRRESIATVERVAANAIDNTDGDGFHAIGSTAVHEDNEAAADGGQVVDDNLDGAQSPTSRPDSPAPRSVDDSMTAAELQSQMDLDDGIEDLELDLPRHEKSSIIKMLTNFWAERSASSWETLYYPLRDIDHVFANSDIIVREDEPSSLVALALDHGDYQAQLRSIEEASAKTRVLSERAYVEDLFLDGEEQASIERSLLQDTGHHLNYQFERGAAKMQCKIFWAEQFEAVRRKCGVSERIVESLSRCLKWDSKGGKTKSVFLKTLDDRFVLKSLSQVETRSFLRFAPFYFNLMGEALFHELPSLIAKMLGFYQVTIKNPVTGTDFDWYLILMENLFYDRTPDHTFDLKGSMRNRRITPSGEQNEVLLDENMVDYIAESPIFAREHSKKLLRSSIYNDTLFLAKRNVMDYSLMLGIDEDKRELVVGIIDCIRTYTWDKKLETWVKDRGKNRPTVTEPRDYKNRFREAINRYVMETPNCWHAGMAPQLGFKNARLESAMLEDDTVLVDATIDEI